MPEISMSNVKVADSARTAQPTVLEVPVTIQGSKPVEGQEKRELFTETTKTTLVFANGAVVNLASRLLAGQCVFVRNENSGREILCKVLESRPAGPTNYTDLEFTAHDPNFWDAPSVPSVEAVQPLQAVKPAPSVQAVQPALIVQPEQVGDSDPRSAAQRKIDAAVASLSATEMMESSAPAVENLPVPAPEDAEGEPEPPSPKMPEVMANHEPAPVPLHAPGNSSNHALGDENVPEPNDSEDAEHLAALIAMDGKPKSNRESAVAAKPNQTDASATHAAPQGVTSAPAASRAASISTLELRLRTLPFMNALKNPVAMGIAASVLMAAVVGVAWHVKRASSARKNDRASAIPIPQRQQPPASIAESSHQPTSTSGSGSAASAPAGIQNSATATANHGSVPEPRAAKDSQTPVVISVKASIPGSDRSILAKPKHRKSTDPGSEDIVPPKIVSQSQPGIPTWAQGIDTDGVVQLDALIDEKGNVKETKPLSGPKALQREAERVVALWVFEPAMAGGKPTATHMVLTVQFQM